MLQNIKKYLNYKTKSKNKLLNSNTHFNEVYFEVEKHRKKDFFLMLKEQPSLFFLNYINSFTRHLFFLVIILVLQSQMLIK